MSETRARYLHVGRSAPSDTPADVSDTATRSEGAQAVEGAAMEDAAVASTAASASPPASTPASAALSQAIMYAAMSWLSLCVERTAAAMDIQPIADGLYEVSAHFDTSGGERSEAKEGIILRVRLEVAPGLVARTVVEHGL